MHVTGKLLILVLIGTAIFAFIKAGQLVKARGTWMQKVQADKAHNETTAAALVTARADFEQARAELERENLRWDRNWSDVSASFYAANSTLIAKAGSAVGIPANTTLYAFELAPSGPVYVGAFGVNQVQIDQSLLKAAFRVRADDSAKWTEGTWRLRSQIPSAYSTRIADLQKELAISDEVLAKQRSNLETQNQLLAASKEQREDRIGELLGGRKADNADEGLVARITKADDQRNESLAEVDRLRRLVREAKLNAERLLRENGELASHLMDKSTPKQQAIGPAPSF
jgi:hypothetical protein